MKLFTIAATVLMSVMLSSPSRASVILIDDFAPGPVLGSRSQTGLVFYSGTGNAQLIANPSNSLAQINWNFFPNLNVGESTALQISGFLDSSGVAQLYVRVNGVEQTRNLAVSQGGDFEFRFGSVLGDPSAPVQLVQVGLRQLVSTQSNTFTLQNVEFFQPAPEPGTMALIGLVAGGGGWSAWRRRRKAAVA
jgi:hypothetical protein